MKGRIFGVGFSLRITGYDLVRTIVGILLLVAALLKGYQLATEPVLGGGLLESRWVLILAVEFELFFGLWLLVGCWPKPTWMAALTCFAFFLCVSLYKALSGYTSCGCFGRVAVNPWYTAVFDLTIMLVLLRWGPKGHDSLSVLRFERLPRRGIAVFGGWVLLAVPAAITMGIYQPALLSVAGDIVGDEPIVLLEPETWIGKSFPLLDYTDIGAKLKEGEWLALLYHHDCPKCQDAMKQLKAVANQADGLRVALIEMPPYGKTPGDIGAPELFVMSRLLAVKDWFAQTPVLLVLSEGQVVRVGRPESLLVDIVKNVRK